MNNIPKHWQVKKLIEVCDVLDNLRKPINSTERYQRIKGKNCFDLFPYYGATGLVGWIDGYITDDQYILIGEDGAPFLDIFKDKAYKITGKSWVNNHAHILKGKKGVISDDFVLYYLNSINYRAFVNGTTRLKLTKSSLIDIPILLPPLSQQLEIVSKIEELLSDLENGKQQLIDTQQQLKVYRQSILKAAFEGKLSENWRKNQKTKITTKELSKKIQSDKAEFSNSTGKKTKQLVPILENEQAQLPKLPQEWLWVKLGDNAFVTKLAGFEFTKYVKYRDEGDIPVIRAQNVSRRSFIPRNFIYVDRGVMEKLPRSRIHGGEILMVFVGAGLGNVGIVPENHEYFLGPNVAKIALESHFNNKYIFHFLTSQLGFANIIGMSKATAQGSISMANIREVLVPLISFEEQQLIVAELESKLTICDKIEEAISEALHKSETLKQSILKKAFEGKLV